MRLLGSYCLRGARVQSRRIVSLALLPLLLLRFHPPPRLFKTGYGANNFQRAHISFHSWGAGEGTQRLGSWRSDQVVHACPEWVLASLLAARLSKLHQLHSSSPLKRERGGTKRCGTGSSASQRKMGTDERVDSVHVRAETPKLPLEVKTASTSTVISARGAGSHARYQSVHAEKWLKCLVGDVKPVLKCVSWRKK